MNDELTQLRQILAIARTGSFTRAAQELHITQPVLSRSIASFEKRHGVRLFERGRGGAVPTTLGVSVIADAAKLLRSARNFQDNLQLYRLGDAGRVAVGLGPLLASMVLPEVSKSLLRQRPKLKLSTIIGPVDQLIAHLMDDDVELIFGNCTQLEAMPEICAKPIGKLELAFIVRNGHPLDKRANLTAADIAAFPVASAVALPAGGLSDDGGSFTCDNFHILRETTRGSDCIWLSSPAFVADELGRGDLAILDVGHVQPRHSIISVTYRRGREVSPAAACVIDEVRSILCRNDSSGQACP